VLLTDGAPAPRRIPACATAVGVTVPRAHRSGSHVYLPERTARSPIRVPRAHGGQPGSTSRPRGLRACLMLTDRWGRGDRAYVFLARYPLLRMPQQAESSRLPLRTPVYPSPTSSVFFALAQSCPFSPLPLLHSHPCAAAFRTEINRPLPPSRSRAVAITFLGHRLSAVALC
jgi:hypothetical protein